MSSSSLQYYLRRLQVMSRQAERWLILTARPQLMSHLPVWFLCWCHCRKLDGKIVRLRGIADYTPTYKGPDNNFDEGVESSLKSLEASIVQSAANPITAQQIGDPGMPTTVGSAQGGAWGLTSEVSGKVTNWATKHAGEFIGINPKDPTNAIMQLKDLGDNILTVEEVGLAGYLGLKAAATTATGGVLASGASKIAQKAIAATGPMEKYITKAVGLLTGGGGWVMEGAGVFIIVTVTGFAIMLAFWMPMTPFVLWIGSFMGWLIAVCEMVVAAPLFAAAHLHPEGEGMASRYGANGYMIIIEVFAKPVLVVVGFFIAARFSDPFIRFFSSIFFTSMQTVNGDSVSGIVTGLVFTLMYVVICISLVTRSFSLIHIIPNSVMRWIGGNGGMFDQAEGIAPELKGQTQAGMSNVMKIGEMAGAARIARHKEDEERISKEKNTFKS